MYSSGPGSQQRYGARGPKSQGTWPRSLAKKAPDDMVMLNVTGDNILIWKNVTAVCFEAKYGSIAGYVRNNAYPVREVFSAETLQQRFPAITPAMSTKMILENMTTVVKEEKKDEERKFEMFALLERVVTAEGWNRVKSREGFAEAETRKCPLMLLRIIVMEHSLKMNNVTDNEARYIAEDRYHKILMHSEASLAEYGDEFQLCVSNMETLKCEGIPSEERMARHFMMKLDRDRYGGYMRDVLNDDRNGVRAMPDTRQRIVDGARMHIPTPVRRSDAPDRQGMPTVYALSAKQLKHPCKNCNKLGHWVKDCPEPDSRKSGEEKEIQAPAVRHAEADYVNTEDLSDEAIFGYVFALTKEMAARLDPREVAIDTFANVNFICNKDLLPERRKSEMTVKGFNESKKTAEVGLLPGFGDAVYAPWAGVNGLAMCLIEEKYTVTYFQQNRIEVRINDDFVLKFLYKAKLGCYACMFDEEIMFKLSEHETRFNYHYCNMAMVSEQEKGRTTKEVIAARKARIMMRRLYYPADSALVRTITKGAMVECSVTGRDVVLATEVYGKDVASLKGKTKDRKPQHFTKLLVPLMSQKEQVVYADVFHWRQVNFIIFIIKPLRLVMVQWLPKLDTPNVKAAVMTVCNKIEARGYTVQEVVVDPFKSLASLAGLLPRNITVVGSRAHVADAEVEIRTVKERVRSSTHGLPYNAPRRLVRWQVYGAVMTYNMLLRQGQTVSSRELFTGVKTNYSRDVRAEFGEYVQAHVSPSEMNIRGTQERTVGAVALISADNDRGTWWFMGLTKGTFFRADRWTTMPVTDVVIEALNKMHGEDEKDNSKKKKRSVALAPEDIDETRTMIQNTEERDTEVQALGPATEMAGPEEEEVLTVDIMPEEEVDVVDIEDEATSRREYEHSLERVATAQSELDEFNRMESEELELVEFDREEVTERGEEEEELTDINEEDKEVGEGKDENDEMGLADPYDNFTGLLGARMVGGTRRSCRIDDRRRKVEQTLKVPTRRCVEERIAQAYKLSIVKEEKRAAHVYRISVKQALKKNEKASKASMMKELRQIVDKDVFDILEKANLSKRQLRKAIRSSMFLTEKFTASGEFDKLKARLVAGGDGQDKSLYENLSSPTVAQETIMMVLAIAAIEKRKVATIDITGAYLECDIDEDDEVIMTIDPFLAKLLSQIDPTVSQKTDEKGVIYVRLKKALYGCVQSAKLWYDKLCKVLEDDGYVKNDYDGCLFNKIVDGVQVTVAFHVDDLLITSVRGEMVDELEALLKSKFQAITINKSDKHSYLAMNMLVDTEGIHLDMIAYIDKCLEGKKIGRSTYSPATDDLFEVPEDGVLLCELEKKMFHSDVAKLLYLAKRTRGQILTAVSHLSGRVNVATADDQVKLDRVFAYLSTTKDEVLHLKSGGSVIPEVYIDASFGVHSDGTSRTGMVIMLAGAAIACWSSKQKLVTKSSTEAEVVALSDGLTNALWMREMVLAQGYKLAPTRIYEDNEGVLKIMKSGRSPKHRTRHLNIRHFFARDRVQTGDIELVYKPTGEMIADMMTKPVTGRLFNKLGSELTGNACQRTKESSE